MGYDFSLGDEFVLTHAKAFHLHPRFSLIGGVDPDEKLCSDFKDRYQCNAFTSIEGASQSNLTPDIVIISVPTSHHYCCMQQVFTLFKPQAILCEKPLAYKMIEAEKMAHLCKKNNAQLYVNYPRRSQPSVFVIKKRLASGKIKAPVRGVVWYSKGIMHNGSHFVNLLSFWFGQVINTSTIGKICELKSGDVDVDVIVDYKKGSVLFRALNEDNYSHYGMELYAQNGRLSYDFGGRKINWAEANKSKIVPGYTYLSDQSEEIPSDMDKSQWHVVDQLAKSLNVGQGFVSTADDAIATLKVTGKIAAEAVGLSSKELA